MFTGLAHMWMRVGAAQGASACSESQGESGCCSLGHAGTCCLFSSEARAGPAVSHGVFFLSSDAKISLLARSPFGGSMGPLLMGSCYWHKAATPWCLAGECGPCGSLEVPRARQMHRQDRWQWDAWGDCRLPQTPERFGWKN